MNGLSAKPLLDGWGGRPGSLRLTRPLAPRAAHTPAAAAAALHIPVIDGGGDVPVAEAFPFQGVLITAVEGDVAPGRRLLCGQSGTHEPTQTQEGDKFFFKCNHLRGTWT